MLGLTTFKARLIIRLELYGGAETIAAWLRPEGNLCGHDALFTVGLGLAEAGQHKAVDYCRERWRMLRQSRAIDLCSW